MAQDTTTNHDGEPEPPSAQVDAPEDAPIDAFGDELMSESDRPSALHFGNLPPRDFDRGQVAPYTSTEEHLRDEIWRVWLRMEYEIRRRWEWESLPRLKSDTGLGLWKPRDVAGLFRAAHVEYSGVDSKRHDYGADVLLDAYLRHSALLESRVEKTLQAGNRLPLIDIVRSFRLDARQRASLTAALVPEIDPNLLTAYRYLAHDPLCRHLDGRLLAMLVYDTPASRAQLARDLSPRSPLIFYRLLEIEESTSRNDSVLYRRLRPAARLIPPLSGAGYELDAELSDLAALHVELDQPGLFDADHLATAENALQRDGVLLVLQGQRGVGKRLLVRTVARRLGCNVLIINGVELASRPASQQAGLLRALVREARLLDAIPVVPDIDDIATAPERDDEPPYFLSLLCGYHEGAVVITLNRERMPRLHLRPIAHITMGVPSTPERVELWAREVPALSVYDARTLAERYAITGGIIAMSAQAAAATTPGFGSPDLHALDTAVHNQLHGRIQRLGTRLDTPFEWKDLVTDEDTLSALKEITASIRERRQVRERWGFRGAPGVSVLFSGHPGVGKSMSATVVARALGLEIYEIDLSRVVSKWIGETEKNLAEVFDAAEPGHVVLLFNEADSLFGKRTKEVSSSNDRYANMETNYLLQRIERFGGLSILTTNLTKAIDPAFRRRFAYDVHFAFPTSEMRAELWRRAIPPRADVADVDFDELGDRFELSGGYIKVAAERTAFNAAARKEPIHMELLIMTIERMYRERGKLSAVGKLE